MTDRAEQLRELWRAMPRIPQTEIAHMLGCHPGYISALARKLDLPPRPNVTPESVAKMVATKRAREQARIEARMRRQRGEK